MTRGELELLDRDALIARAEQAGVARARILTRPELVDELLLRAAVDDVTMERTRGLFGRARDLLARLVERGLNKPYAADRIRAVGRPLARPSLPAALPTLTLAEIYVAQGYRERAMETLERVLAAEPEHIAARALLARLRDAAFAVPAPQLPPEAEPDEAEAPSLSAPATSPSPQLPAPPSEPAHMLDDSPLPPRYDVDECVGIAVDPRTLYVYWEVRPRTMAELVAHHGEAMNMIVRVIAVEPAWSGPRTSVRDFEVQSSVGDLFASDLPVDSVVRAAVGIRRGTEFIVIAHSPSLATPSSVPAPLPGLNLMRWTPIGAIPLARGEADAFGSTSVARAVARVRQDSAAALRHATSLSPLAVGALGASEGLPGARGVGE
jgi:hypothetical protein